MLRKSAYQEADETGPKAHQRTVGPEDTNELMMKNNAKTEFKQSDKKYSINKQAPDAWIFNAVVLRTISAPFFLEVYDK